MLGLRAKDPFDSATNFLSTSGMLFNEYTQILEIITFDVLLVGVSRKYSIIVVSCFGFGVEGHRSNLDLD